jgi:hypothetical protein
MMGISRVSPQTSEKPRQVHDDECARRVGNRDGVGSAADSTADVAIELNPVVLQLRMSQRDRT